MQELDFFGIPIIYYLLVVAFLLPKIPFVGKFFNIINTLVHEFGHAILALLLQGQVLKIQIFSDTSGVTLTKSNSTICAFFVSLAGYPFASLVAYLCAYLLSVGYGNGIVIGLSILFLFMLLLWIRNGYGLLWVAIFLCINGLLLFYLKNDLYLQIAACFYTLMILIESVWSTLVLTILSFRDADKAGDATNLRNFTKIPTVVWALAFTLLSCWLGWKSVGLLFGL